MSEDVRRLSDELARDPSSLVFLALAEKLRARGDVDLAYQIARRGAERHPGSITAHDLVARLASDRGELDVAYSAWSVIASLDPTSALARKGQAFVRHQQGRFEDAERHLLDPPGADGDSDSEIATALARIRQRTPSYQAVQLPQAIEPAVSAPSHDLTVLHVDGRGNVVSGECIGSDGSDVSAEVAGHLGDIGSEARRAMQHLSLGDWRTIQVESEQASVMMAPLGADEVVLVAAAPLVPLGQLRRSLTRERDARLVDR